MTNTYTWGLQSPPRVSKILDGITNVIRSVDWCVTATSDQNDAKGSPFTAYRYGGPLEFDAPNPASFTPFEQVTLADVAEWTQAALGAEQVAALVKSMDDEIAAKIAADKDPTTPVPMVLEAV